MNYHECLESETRSDSDDDGSDEQLFYGLKMRAADPRYITNGDDGNRGDILLTLAQVRELIIRKKQSEEGVATANHSRNGFLFDRRTKRDPMSQGCKGRESQRPISSSSNITICYKYSGKSWNWGGNGSASQGRLAGTSEFAQESSNARISLGKKTPSCEWRMIRRTSRIVMFRPRSESIFFSTNRSQKG